MSTLSERILGAPAGEFVDRQVDRAYVHDGTGVLTLESWKSMGASRLTDASGSTYASITSARRITVRLPLSSARSGISPGVRS